ncbi:hypothetical protein [Aquisalibacillus elongatus]|uniref:Antibiotic biosynthesis monooxygenase n=1 Tax=Aquisalibacillus elongatus TaxID=485577 RepID=A0A3N5CE80_9BACI|nr:hypothetical protein [Aquisalibacillus elongatus]RPF55481.1 hypothetical protein EDC24_0358 [Aquisalibacillus elongatus]
MFVKVYKYHIQNDKVNEYISIQERAAEIYGKYLDFNTIYLQSKEDSTKWMEITKYKNEEEYHKSINLINEEDDIQDLFKAFQTLLSSEKREISEEDFVEMKEINSC